jgi:hypothetical protein
MLPKGSGPYLTLPSTGHAITDSLQIVRQAFTHPNVTTLFVPEVRVSEPKAPDKAEAKPVEKPKAKPASKGRAKIPTALPATAKTKPSEISPPAYFVDPRYNWLLIAVFIFTVACIIVELALATLWTDTPTHFQEQSFGAIDWGYKIGIGLFIGLLGGKRV